MRHLIVDAYKKITKNKLRKKKKVDPTSSKFTIETNNMSSSQSISKILNLKKKIT